MYVCARETAHNSQQRVFGLTFSTIIFSSLASRSPTCFLIASASSFDAIASCARHPAFATQHTCSHELAGAMPPGRTPAPALLDSVRRPPAHGAAVQS